jgi:DNA primase
MFCKQANSIPIVEILDRLNISYRKSGAGYLCQSPFRGDKNPSCYVIENRWKDMATGEHGRTIDLIARMFNCSITDALYKLDSIKHGFANFSFQKQENREAWREPFEPLVKKIQPLKNIALVNYMESRAIPKSLSTKYCQEIYFDDKGKNLFYVAFANDNGGYALRNKYQKRCLGRNGVTTLNRNENVVIVEGFISFLSILIVWPELQENSFVVLNSVANVGSSIEKIKYLNPRTVNLYLDNDEAGTATTNHLTQQFPIAIDQRRRFAAFKDANELLKEHSTHFQLKAKSERT